MKIFLSKLFGKLFAFLGDFFTARFKWLNDNLFRWLSPLLKGIGFSGLGLLSFDAFRSSFNQGVDKLGVFAQILQIDDVLDSINSVFLPVTNKALNTDFIGICGAFGIITAINQILNAVAWSFIVALALVCMRLFLVGGVQVVKFIGLNRL